MDERFITAKKSGIKDLYFEARFPYLKKRLNEQKIYGKIEEIFFKVYWTSNGKYKIDLYGMPKGFKELREKLQFMLSAQLGFFFEPGWGERLKKLTTKIEGKDSTGIRLSAKDLKYVDPANEIILYLNNNKDLNKVVVKSPSGTEITNYDFSTTKWSKGKLVLQSMKVKNFQGKFSVLTGKKISYMAQKGFHVPESIEIDSEQNLAVGTAQKRSHKKNYQDKIILSSYKINQGIAKQRLAAP
jgi:hypothetical protein